MGGFFDRLQGPFGSEEPRQYDRKHQISDPTKLYPEERNFIRDRLFTDEMFGPDRPPGISAGGSTYKKARPEQNAVMAAMAANTRATQPLFRVGTGTMEDVAGGGYLDVANTPGFKALADARRTTAMDLFRSMADDIDERAAARGIYDSSARHAQRNRAGERVSNEAAADIARAGFAQYGAERNAMDAAARHGTELNPRLNQILFGEAETLRGAEQQAAQYDKDINLRAQLGRVESYLKARGLDQRDIDQMLDYLKTVSGQVVGSVVGPSVAEGNRAQFNTDVGALTSLASI